MSRPAPSDIRQRITMRCVRDVGAGANLPVVLGYSMLDPYAVSLSFGTMTGDIVWTFGRDLLRDGLGGSVGIGDVRIRPGVDQIGRGCLFVEFRSPDGELLVETPSAAIHEFLERAYDLVPGGEESAMLDVDAMIDQLLAV